jgi:spermidine/putrescine-binding protein
MLGRTAVSRRNILRAAGGIALVGLAPARIARAADTLVVNAYGGEFGDILKKTVIAPFERKFGVQVVFDDTGTSSTNYAKIRATKGAPGFDVAAELTAAENFLGASEKLLLPITEKEVPNLAHVWAKSRTMIPPNGTVNYCQYASIFYHTQKVKRPTSWLDYFKPAATYGETIKGRLLAFHPANVLEIYAIAMGAKTQGGGIENMEPGWKLLEQQKPYIAEVPTMSSAAVPFFENGTVWLAPFWSARAADYKARGLPFDFVIPKEGTMIRRHLGHSGERGEPEAGAGIPQFPPGAGHPARILPRLLREPRTAGHRGFPAGVRRLADHHRGADGRTRSAGRAHHRREDPRLDAALPGDHELSGFRVSSARHPR